MADDRGTLDGIAEVVTIDEGVAYVHALSGRQIFTAPLQGVPAGAHTVVVGAKGHLGSVRAVELKEGEAQTLEFSLPKR